MRMRVGDRLSETGVREWIRMLKLLCTWFSRRTHLGEDLVGLVFLETCRVTASFMLHDLDWISLCDPLVKVLGLV